MAIHFPRIAILGAGSMGGALLDGLLQSGAGLDGIIVTNRTEVKAAPLRSPRIVSLSTEIEPDANRVAVRGAHLVLVAVKPAMVPDLLAELRDAFEPDALIISVAAGVTLASMEDLVPNVVFRSAPNTPSIVRRGVTGLVSSSRATSDDTAMVRALFETVGVVLEVPEEKINALSAISASGPAYVFFLIEQLTQTAQHLGFDKSQAELIVQQTFRAASELLASSGVRADELSQQVLTDTGSTERAVEVLKSGNLSSVFDRATASAIARAEEMAKGL